MARDSFKKVFDKRGLQKYVHKNGLTVIFRVKPDTRSVTLGIGSRFGLIHHPLTHPHHHMVFKGTTNKTGIEINEEAVQWGDTLDAFTDCYSTFFFIKVIPQHTYRGFWLLCDMLKNPSMEKEAIEREKKIVIEEVKGWHGEPKRVLRHLICRKLYSHHPIRNSLLEDLETIKRATREEFLDLHRQFYLNSAHRLIVVAVGRFNAKRLLKKIEQCLGELTKGIEVPFSISTDNGRPKTTKMSIRRWSGTQAHVMFGFRAPLCFHPDYLPMRVLSAILGEGRDSRLRTELREKQGIVFVRGPLHPVSEYDSSRWHGALQISTTCDPKNLPAVKRAVLKELKRLAKEPVAERELKRNKVKLIRQHHLSLEGTKRHARLLFAEEINGMLEKFDSFPYGINKVKAKDVQRVARMYCSPSKAACAILKPFKKPRKKK